MIISGRLPNTANTSNTSRERSRLSSIFEEVLRRGKNAGRSGYAHYTVQVRASLDGAARQSSWTDLMARGSGDLSAKIRVNSSITFKTDRSSFSGKFDISAWRGQQVEIEGRYFDLDRSSTEVASFYAK